MKIICVAICKNEEGNIPAFLENLSSFGITELCVVDTGSTDRSIQLFKDSKEVKVNLKHVVIEPFSFADARNNLIDMIPPDADFTLHLDLDERIKSMPTDLEKGMGYSGDREEVLYGMVSKGMHRLTPPAGWKWQYPIHEHMYPEFYVAYKDDFIISHYQKPDKDCYESLTELYFDSDPKRLYFYRLTDLIHNSKCKEFAELFKKYGTWELNGQQRWLAVKNYQMSLLNIGRKADPEFFNILIEANSSSSWYYLFLCYDSINEYDTARVYFNEAENNKFPEENETKFFNSNIKKRARSVAHTKKGLYE
jgi:glycosyltransferase involved in cell wall biosynthesis